MTMVKAGERIVVQPGVATKLRPNVFGAEGTRLPRTQQSDCFNVLNDAAALMPVRGADFLSVRLPGVVVQNLSATVLAMLFLRLHHQEMMAAEMP
jgi:hypothetical protein